MRGRNAVTVVLLVLVLFCEVNGSSARNGKNFLWMVRSSKGTVYLLGSVHLMKENVYPLDSQIEGAFRKSDVLAVEANIDKFNSAEAGHIAKKALYPSGDSLGKHLSERTYDLVKREALKLAIPLEIIDAERPWFVALTFTSFELVSEGLDPRYGIDEHFLSEAEGKKKIVELESIDYQINLLSNLSENEQEIFLRYTLKDLQRLGSETAKMLHAWKTGNAEEMAALVSRDSGEDKELASFYGRLLYDRNRTMAAKIEGFLRTDRTYFVVVGAGHLVGKKGIVSILREKGYQVEQL